MEDIGRDKSFHEEGLTRKDLADLERRERTGKDRAKDALLLILPIVMAILALVEYIFVPDKIANRNPQYYIYFLVALVALYVINLFYGLIRLAGGNKDSIIKLRNRAPLVSALFAFFAIYDILTLKTGILTQPFIPHVNAIINAMIVDRAILWESAKHTLFLMFLGYFIGVALGLVTGVACGYSKTVDYWLSPIISFLGPIPTVTWVPVMMVIAGSLFQGAVFIIALGSWFAVTVATRTGISNVDSELFDAARTLGANDRQLIFNVAVPGAVPSILQGLTQALSSACVSIMVAEMLGVEAGLGWYMNWQKSWASYDKMFAALIIICLIFIVVTKLLDRIKAYLLRWQNKEVN